jgi:hypothetical protein
VHRPSGAVFLVSKVLLEVVGVALLLDEGTPEEDVMTGAGEHPLGDVGAPDVVVAPDVRKLQHQRRELPPVGGVLGVDRTPGLRRVERYSPLRLGGVVVDLGVVLHPLPGVHVRVSEDQPLRMPTLIGGDPFRW